MARRRCPKPSGRCDFRGPMISPNCSLCVTMLPIRRSGPSGCLDIEESDAFNYVRLAFLKNLPNNWYSPQINSIGVPSSASFLSVGPICSRSVCMVSCPLSWPPPPTMTSACSGNGSPGITQSRVHQTRCHSARFFGNGNYHYRHKCSCRGRRVAL